MNYQIFQNPATTREHSPLLRDNRPGLPVDGGPGVVDGLLNGIRAWLLGIDSKRKEEFEIARAIEHLQGLTEEQLRDIGISRLDIERAVRFGRDQV